MATRLAEGRHRYRVQRRLGGGATSDFWLAEREGSTTRVAIKVARQACDRDRLCDEAERLLFADCPALTAALDAGFLADGGGAPELAPGLPFIALEWADGESLEPKERGFLYMPFQHSEDLYDQKRSLQLFTKLGDDEQLRYAKLHHDIIDRFGRFPHRNAILGRAPRPAEVAAGDVVPW
jgi:serine/threonine protein kinase